MPDDLGKDKEIVIKKIDKVKLKLALLRDKFRNGLKGELERQGQIIVGRAQEILYEKDHVVTGNLVRSLSTEAVIEKSGDFEVHVGTNVHYAIYVELLPDGGYFTPALREKRAVVIKNIRELMRKIQAELEVR